MSGDDQVQRRRCIRCKYLVACLLLAVSPAFAEPAGSCDGAAFRQFDFWLGSWDVYLPDGALAGHNRIESEQAGCVLVERWRGVKGGTGTSLNFYDPVDDRWRQIWVSPGSEIDIAGTLSADGMVLVGSITYLAEGQRYPFRGTWTAQGDGRVRQFFEESRTAGEWQPWFEGFYVRSAALD